MTYTPNAFQISHIYLFYIYIASWQCVLQILFMMSVKCDEGGRERKHKNYRWAATGCKNASNNKLEWKISIFAFLCPFPSTPLKFIKYLNFVFIYSSLQPRASSWNSTHCHQPSRSPNVEVTKKKGGRNSSKKKKKKGKE